MAETSSLLRNHTHYAYRGFESLPLRHYHSLVVTVDNKFCACVAQLDRVPGYEPGGRRFESFHTRHIEEPTLLGGLFHFLIPSILRFFLRYFCISALFEI